MVFLSRMIVAGVFNIVQVNPDKPFALAQRTTLEIDCVKSTRKKIMRGIFSAAFYLMLRVCDG